MEMGTKDFKFVN